MSKNIISILIILSSIIVGCSAEKESIGFSDDLYIKVTDWNDENKVLIEITDSSFIKELVDSINSSDKKTTGNISVPEPDYLILFYKKEELIKKIGYYKTIQNIDVKGRYWNQKEDIFYSSNFKISHLE